MIQPSESDVVKILKDVVALIGARVPTETEVLFLSVPTNKQPEARFYIAPTDVELRRLICDALAANDGRAVKSAVAAIEKHVGDDKQLRKSLGVTATILTEGRTCVRNRPIVQQLRQWSEEYKETSSEAK